MPRYAWTAVNPDGIVIKGSTVALDSRGVADQLRRDGCSVVAVTRRKWPPTNIHVETVSRRDIITFTYRLIPLLASTLALNRCLQLLKEETKKHRIRNALVLMAQDVNSGASLSDSMAKHRDIFSVPYLSAVRAGERSGNIVRALTMMGNFLEWLDDIVKQIWALISYPILVVVALMVLNFVLAFYAIPTFITLYRQLGLKIEIPLPTRIIFAYSSFMSRYWPVLLFIAAIAIVIFMLRRRVPKLQDLLHRVYLRIPMVGEIIRRMQVLQFCRFFQMLYENGVDMRQSLQESRGVLTNNVLRRAVDSVVRSLEGGSTLAEAFQRAGQFPPLVAEQLRVGEQSGNIGEAIGYIIRYYDSELEYSMRRFTTFLRPALIAVLAAVMLILALAFYLPLFEVVNLIR